MKQNALYPIVIAWLIMWGQAASFAQCTARVTHTRGDSLIECTKVHISSEGVTDTAYDGCSRTIGPYIPGYNAATPAAGNGSYTFTFTPAISSLRLDFRGVTNFSGAEKELIRLYVNGQHYKLSGASQAPAALWP